MITDELTSIVKNKKAIVWDMDGVVIFLDWQYGEVWNKWWDRLWVLLEKYDPGVRLKFKDGLKHYYEHTNYIADKFGDKALNEIKNFFVEKERLILPVSSLNNEIVQFIKNLPEGIEQYIWSNNYEETILHVLEKADIQSKIKAIIARDKVILAKPELEGYKIIQRLTRVQIKDFVLIGDSEVSDKVAAEKLGMDFYLYKRKA